jgi:hypothetical protein
VIGRLAGADSGEQRAPGVGHASSDSRQIEAQTARLPKPPARGFVEREASTLRLFEDASAHQMAQDAMQRIAIGARRGGHTIDIGGACFNMIGDAQRCRHVNAPWRTEITQGPQIHRTI